MVENSQCRSFVLKNDNMTDPAGTRVFIRCNSGKYVEVDSVKLSAEGKYGSPGCELTDGSALEWGTNYSGDSDPLYDPPLFAPSYFLAYYPPSTYNASYTATYTYKLQRGAVESLGTVTCKVPAP